MNGHPGSAGEGGGANPTGACNDGARSKSNLYLGADLTPVIQSQNLQQFLAATTAVWTMVVKNDFHARAQALATETRPVILVGDLNSHPGTEGEAVLAAA